MAQQHGSVSETGFFPEETFPRGKCRRLEESMFKDCLNTTECLNDIRSICVQVPQLAVVPLTCPPERVALHQLIRLEFSTSTESLIEAERTPVFLEQSVDTWKTTVPTILEILKCQSSVLLVRLLSLLRVLGPHSLRIDELSFPRDDITKDVRNQSLFVMCHTRTVVGNTSICLLRPSLVTRRDQNMRSRDHSKSTQLLGSVEDRGWEAGRHLGIETNLNSSLDLRFALDDSIE